MRNIWEILGIDATTDRKEIKKAYARKTKQYHPEDNPEEFQIIQEAYQMAINYAKNSKDLNKEHVKVEESNYTKVLDNYKFDTYNSNYNIEKEVDTRNSIDFEEYNSELEGNLLEDKEYRKMLIYEELEELRYERENSDRRIDIDYEELARQFEIRDKKEQQAIYKNNSEEDVGIFNEVEKEYENEEELKHMNYFLGYVERKIPNKINMEMFKKLLENSYVKSYINNYEFKNKFEAIMVEKSYADTLYTEKKMAEIARENHLYRVAREIEKNTKRRYVGGIRKPVFIMWIIIVSIVVNIALELKREDRESQISKSISENIENTDEKMHRIKESLLKTNLIINENAINGYGVEVNENGYYLIKNADGEIVQDKINFVEFTTTSLIISKKAKSHYIINTSNGELIKVDYKKVKSVDIIEKDDKKIGLAALDKDDKWYIIDSYGNKLYEIKGKKDGSTFDVFIKNGKASFLKD